jgi:hypothetical protein
MLCAAPGQASSVDGCPVGQASPRLGTTGAGRPATESTVGGFHPTVVGRRRRDDLCRQSRTERRSMPPSQPGTRVTGRVPEGVRPVGPAPWSRTGAVRPGGQPRVLRRHVGRLSRLPAHSRRYDRRGRPAGGAVSSERRAPRGVNGRAPNGAGVRPQRPDGACASAMVGWWSAGRRETCSAS